MATVSKPMAELGISAGGASASETDARFNAQSLKSPVVKISLADGDWAEYYIHKEILTSLSLEMKKHIENEMREGLQGAMVLWEVDDETMQRFLEWAYVKTYTIKRQDESSALLAHIKLYVFADRFNIKTLQDACFSNLSTLVGKKQPWMSFPVTTIAAVIKATSYAVENLPSLKDRAVDSLLEYISNALPSAPDLRELKEMFQMHPDVEKVLLQVSLPEDEPAWKSEVVERGSVCRLVSECSSCRETTLITRVECQPCSMTIQARYDGWFHTDVKSLRCSECGLCTRLWCRTCLNDTLDSYREMIWGGSDYSPVGYYSPPDYDLQLDNDAIDNGPSVYVDDDGVYGPEGDDDEPSVGVDDGIYGSEGDDDEVLPTRYTIGIPAGNRVRQDIDDNEDIYARDEAPEDDYRSHFYDRDEVPNDDDFDDFDDFDGNEAIEDGYDADCYDGDLGELFD